MAFNQSLELTGLTNVQVAAPVAGCYRIAGQLQLPRLAAGSTGPSAVVCTVTNNTGPVTLLTTTAGADGFSVDTVCAAGDVLEVALTSSNAADEVLNAIKAQIQVSSGV